MVRVTDTFAKQVPGAFGYRFSKAVVTKPSELFACGVCPRKMPLRSNKNCCTDRLQDHGW